MANRTGGPLGPECIKWEGIFDGLLFAKVPGLDVTGRGQVKDHRWATMEAKNKFGHLIKLGGVAAYMTCGYNSCSNSAHVGLGFVCNRRTGQVIDMGVILPFLYRVVVAYAAVPTAVMAWGAGESRVIGEEFDLSQDDVKHLGSMYHHYWRAEGIFNDSEGNLDPAYKFKGGVVPESSWPKTRR